MTSDVQFYGTAMIWGAAPDERPYSDRSYDPFWHAASEAKLGIREAPPAGAADRTPGRVLRTN